MPIDPTPHFGEVLHKPEKQFPKPTPDVEPGDKPTAGDDGTPSMRDRPAIPSSTETMAVDIEDEEDDPVVESGPGLEKRQTSLLTKD